MNKSSKILSAALMTAATLWIVAPAGAAPISSPHRLQNAVASSVETVRYRRGRHGRHRDGRIGSAAFGLAASAIIGAAIYGATRSDGYYDQEYVTESPYVGGNEVAYCQRRFRSYDLASGTFLGFDGLRHSCP